MKKELTNKQEAFCREYILNGGNATQAAISAGYSKHTARFVASENLTKPNIKKIIENYKLKAQEAFMITVEERLSILKQVTEKGLEPFIHEQSGTVKAPALSAVVSAVSEINKMMGDDNTETEPTVYEVNFNVREPVKPQ